MAPRNFQTWSYFPTIFLFTRFKLKYHPEDSVKRREELRSALIKRVKVFQDFNNKKLFEGLSVDGDKSDELVKVLDSVVIMLEGGTEDDLKVC